MKNAAPNAVVVPPPVCRTVLLPDEPSAKDAFGPHGRVATAIAGMIQSEAGGRAIALEGTWGSGKSTVVELLKASLPKQVFVFDAWAHTGDPLRRAFLEQLITFYKGRLDDNKWKLVFDRLSRRIKVTESVTTPKLTWIGVIVAVLLLCIPLGSAFVGAELKSNQPLNLTSNRILVAGLAILGSLPVLCAVFAMSIAARHLVLKVRGKSATAGIPVGDLSLFLNKTENRQRQETHETPDPTSREFEQTFESLMCDTLGKTSDRLVIVFDNLDRVRREDALQIWSTLRVFIELCHRKKDNWSNRVWLLVPYDRSAISDLWGGGGILDGDGTRRAVPADSFLDKTFQVRFQVPPLILEDWIDYLTSLLAQVLPTHSATEFRAVASLYQLFLDGQQRQAPTPRELKLFANDIGSLHRQWADRYPLDHLAYYLIAQRSRGDISLGLLHGFLPESPYDTQLDSAVVDSMTGLLFNSDPEHARSLLYKGRIEAALRGDVAGELDMLSKGKGFGPVFQKAMIALPKQWQGNEHALAHALVAVTDARVAEWPDSAAASRAIRQFCKRVMDTTPWQSHDALTGKGSASIVRIMADESITRKVLLPWAASRGNADNADRTSMDGRHLESWIIGVVAIENAVVAMGQEKCLEDGITVPGNANNFFQACQAMALRPGGESAVRRLRTDASDGEVVKILGPDVSATAWPKHLAEFARLMIGQPTEREWGPFKAAAKQFLTFRNVQLDGTSVGRLLDVLWRVGPYKIISELVKNGTLFHHLEAAFEEAAKQQQFEGVAEILWSIVIYHAPLNNAPPQVGRSQSGFQRIQTLVANPGSHAALIAAMADRVASSGWSNPVAHLVEGSKAPSRFQLSILRAIAAHVDSSGVFDASFVAGHFTAMRGHFDAAGASVSEWNEFIGRIVSSASFFDEVATLEFTLTNATVYRELGRLGGFANGPFLQWCETNLKPVGSDEWRKQLRDGGTLIPLAAEVAKQDDGFHLEDELLDGLFEYGKELLAGTASANKYFADNSAAVARLLKPEDVVVLQRRLLRDEFKGHTVGADKFLTVFGEVIAANRKVLEEEDAAIRSIFTPLVQRPTAVGIRWLTQVLRTHALLLDRYPDEDRKDLLDRIAAGVPDQVGDEDLDDDANDDTMAELRDAWQVLATFVGSEKRKRKGRQKREGKPEGQEPIQ